MKNLKYIIAPAIAIVMFASCNTEVAAPSQAELDTQVEAKVKAATDQLKAECDSRIMSAAQLAKDSVLVKLGKQKPAAVAPKPASTTKTTGTKTTTTVKTEPVKTDPVKTQGGLKGLSDQAKQEQGGGKGLKGLSDQEKAKSADQGKKGGLKGLSDQNK